ncbi:DNA polymerase III subunit gamma and tau [Actinoallomurus soli]|uniref:DNA polymerase III subunit gamma and tau n=1 Tax=Actinoallomurus soli TaxID=2952535 RepID=UPI002092BAFF|nr:DNA polymerase III subunit gamma and tau [Actinoallomurus soli]MCO5970095.1 DNA polymerase III subunit gamma and tau [Actinoallomurus soli]
MSLALYRKYRPATFAELKGQEHVAEPLQQALRNGRIHHAYLFSGPRGCGKTSSARILARSLNCEKGPTPEPCGECESCVALGPSGAGHIDVIEIDAASHGGVDDARDLRERAFFAPVAARYKIYIIDEAHMVTREGFNALLKLVEEPPPHLKFIFATTEPEKVIGTIRSRTHHYPFRLIPPGTVRELLEDILQKEGVPYEPAAIPLVVRAGAGSARDSESILDQLLAGAGEEGITYARAVSLLGYTDSSMLDQVVDAVASRDGAAVFAAIDRVMEGGQDPRRFAADLLERFRDLVILSNIPDSGATGLLNVPPDELERMQAQASRLGPAELTRAADLLHTGLTEMRGATSPRLLLELIGARILLPAAYDDEASLLTRLERLERRVAIGGQAPVPAAPAPAASVPQHAQPSAPQSPPAPQPAAPRAEAPVEAARPRPSSPPAPQTQPAPQAQPAQREESPGGARSTDWPVPATASGSAPVSGRASAADWPTPSTASSPAPTAPSAGTPNGNSGTAAPSGGVDVAAIRRMWVDILEAVKQRSKVAWILMEGVEVASLEGQVLTLAFANDGKRRGFTTGGKDVVLRDALKEILGVDWRIDAILAGGSGQGARPAPPPPDAGGWGAPAVSPREPRTPSPSPSPSAPVPPPPPTPVPPPPEPVDEADEVDPEGDADAGSEAALTGMALIEQVLGGKVIQEFDNT